MYMTAITLFPEFFASPMQTSIVGRAVAGHRLDFDSVNPRDFAKDVHRTVDDTPYGGGAGMVMRAPELSAAVAQAHARTAVRREVVMLSPQGAPLTQSRVEDFAAGPGLILVCGRYEGVDERFVTQCVDREISIGDFVLSGGEPAAFILIDAIARLLDGVVGNRASVIEESFRDGLLEHPQFTRPREALGQSIPEVLCSGDHGRVARWRHKAALLRTRARRHDLWGQRVVSDDEQKLLDDARVVVDDVWFEPSRTCSLPTADDPKAVEPAAVKVPSTTKSDKTP